MQVGGVGLGGFSISRSTERKLSPRAEVHPDGDVSGNGQGEAMLSACSASALGLAWAARAQGCETAALDPGPPGVDPW